ncbi:hypothetical protein ALC62_13449 [Cyphomyrmex costatus]|uniref:Uncharacterized protein n=1 Tax=Cyphomyrmex costatus TaxID=456900 RepID=A0A151IA60_9HYME|nr:hypothetical protein ALC62_13449 [Cyphomyrmex costatus]
MEIVNEAFEDVNFEAILDEDDEDVSALSEDSDYNSDQSEENEESKDIKIKVMCPAEIMALNEQTKECAIYFYYKTSDGTSILCTSCMMRIADNDHKYAIREHVIKPHDAIEGKYCSDCRHPCFTIFPTMCPICMN